MRIFVTGANGFIGRVFCRAAVSAGHAVLGLYRTDDVTVPAGMTAVTGDLAHIPWHEVQQFAPDTLLHLAWNVTPGVYMESPGNSVLAAQTANLFRTAVESGIQRLAGAGSCLEYAPSDKPLCEETSALGPASRYTRAKVEVSRTIETLASKHRVPWTWFRIFYCYGEDEAPSRLIPWIMHNLATGESIELKNPDSVKDYIHVDDIASAMLWSLEQHLEGPVNVGSGTGSRILALAREIAGLVHASPSLIRTAQSPPRDPFPITIADISKLIRTGWKPQISLQAGLRRMARTLPPSSVPP